MASGHVSLKQLSQTVEEDAARQFSKLYPEFDWSVTYLPDVSCFEVFALRRLTMTTTTTRISEMYIMSAKSISDVFSKVAQECIMEAFFPRTSWPAPTPKSTQQIQKEIEQVLGTTPVLVPPPELVQPEPKPKKPPVTKGQRRG